MGHFTYADGIAIFQLVYYTPSLFGSIFASARHGAMRTSGWIFLVIFCTIRLVGASARIVTITHPNSAAAYTTALVCTILGLSPLLMASLGLLSRVYYSMLKSPWNFIFPLLVVKVVHTPAVIALVLCIVGATNAPSPEKIDSQSTVHAGVILYTVVLGMLLILTLLALLLKESTEEGESPLLVAVTCAVPFIFVRLLYTLLATFSHRQAFDLTMGSETVALFMSVLPEMIVVVIYIATGLKLQAVPDDAAATPGQTLAYRFGRGDFGLGNLGLLSFGVAIWPAFRKGQQRSREEPVDSKTEHQ